jgi:hypothetical protein
VEYFFYAMHVARKSRIQGDRMDEYAPPQANIDHSPGSGAQITVSMIESLRKTKGWARLVSVMLFIVAALSAIGGVFALVEATRMTFMSAQAGSAKGFVAAMGVAYVLFAFFYGVLAFYLSVYATNIGRLMEDGQTEHMESALEAQWKFWRLAGVFVLIGLALVVVGIVAAIAIPAPQVGR